jgi:AcrR family transcriptional regulator
MRIVEAARACFEERGFSSTTMKDIAARAEVAPQTVYFVFRNKVSILKEALDFAIAGDFEPVAVKDRPWVSELRECRDAEKIVKLLASNCGAITARTAPMFRAIQRAAADPDVERLFELNKRQRAETLELLAQAALASGVLRGRKKYERFADILYLLISEEVFMLLVEERGWSVASWQAWIEERLLRELQAQE